MTAREPLRVAVLISGSGTNLQAIIDAAALDINIVGVISNRPEAAGLERAAKAGIAAIAIDHQAYGSRADYDAVLATQLAELQPELIVLAGYMRILPAATVNQYLGRMLNIHPSLLPEYPGLDTYRRALAAGEQWHGTTVHFVTPELDAGPAILQYRVRIHPEETETQLRERVQAGEYLIYPQAIGWIADGRVELADGAVVMDGERLQQPVIIDELED